MTHTTTLPHYTSILQETATATYLKTKKQLVNYTDTKTPDELWRNHNHPTTQTTNPDHNLLTLKHTIADRLTTNCILCERRCHTNRHTTTGPCHTHDTRIACEFLHTGEEPPLIPSHTIFFSGCPLHCVFCQNWDISQTASGDYLNPAQLAERITIRAKQGSKNVNWVGGDPTANLPYILDVLQNLTINIPQVWNSNMYCSRETMRLLSGVIDLYLTDIKFGNDTCAQRLADVDNYVAVVQRNHLLAAQDGDILVRHLLLPDHFECCTKPVLEWLAAHLPSAVINIMTQYHPEYHAASYPELRRPISSMEQRNAIEYAEKLGLHLL
jgi:putative pyruvate formate lyase activating enzyme